MNEFVKRGWVKNAAIIFLIIMLVLTLFSNHIQNYYLPEVATSGVSSGAINTKIRGTGTVTANESYEVILSQSRVIKSVAVRLGDPVSVGTPLMVLDDTESAELAQARETLETLRVQYQKDMIGAADKDYSKEYITIKRAEEDMAAAIAERDRNFVADDTLISARNDVAADSANAAALNKTLESLQAQAELNPENQSLITRIGETTALLADANARLSNNAEYLSNLETCRNTWAELNSSIQVQQRGLEDLNIDLRIKQDEDRRNAEILAVGLEDSRKKIVEAEQVVERLTSEAVESTMLSDVSGVVRAVNITAGNTAEPEQPLIVVEVVDMGYSLSFAATKEQSSKLKIGDAAEVSGYFWGNTPVQATLKSIKNDTENPNTHKLLSFDVTGDVESGTQLSLAVGQRSQEYETIVPNSAVREDANGAFVLMIMSKSNAMFNRHIATRVDVEVMASDDVNSAVSGGLFLGDYVITSSTAPIENGIQVRLSD